MRKLPKRRLPRLFSDSRGRSSSPPGDFPLCRFHHGGKGKSCWLSWGSGVHVGPEAERMLRLSPLLRRSPQEAFMRDSSFMHLGQTLLPLKSMMSLVASQKMQRAFHIDFQCVALRNIQGAPHLNGKHNSAQLIHLSYDSSRFHSSPPFPMSAVSSNRWCNLITHVWSLSILSCKKLRRYS